MPSRTARVCHRENPGASTSSKRAGFLCALSYEPAFVPEPAPAAWQAGETVRVFIGKGVFIEGHAGVTYVGGSSVVAAGAVDQMVPFLAQLSPSTLAEIVAVMQGENVRGLMAYNHGLWRDPRLEVQEMADPHRSIGRIITTMAHLAHGLEAIATTIPVAQATRYLRAALSSTPSRGCGTGR